MSRNSRTAPPSYDHAVSKLFFLVFFVLFITFGLAIALYAEPFHFWQNAFSDLGNLVTPQGLPNEVPRLIFSLGMLAESIIMLAIRAQYSGEQAFRNQRTKSWLALLGAVGFLVSILPNDRFHGIHSLGVASVVASLYFFALIFHFELRAHITARQFFLDITLLQFAVFPYAVSFFADWASKQSYQKICIMGVFYVLLKAASAAEDSFAPRELFKSFPRFRH